MSLDALGEWNKNFFMTNGQEQNQGNLDYFQREAEVRANTKSTTDFFKLLFQ